MQKQWFCHAKSTGFEAKKHHFQVENMPLLTRKRHSNII
jgi:hypothetical protein